jgi:hypothetical protein
VWVYLEDHGRAIRMDDEIANSGRFDLPVPPSISFLETGELSPKPHQPASYLAVYPREEVWIVTETVTLHAGTLLENASKDLPIVRAPVFKRMA